MILTVITIRGNRKGDFVDIEQIVTYIIVPIVATFFGARGVVKWVIPKIVESYLKRQEQLSQVEIEERRDTRKSIQEEKRLALEYSRTEATEAQRMFGEIISDLQGSNEKGNDFIRSIVFSFERRLTALETKNRLLVNLLTKGTIAVDDDDEPINDYDTWKRKAEEKRKLDETTQRSSDSPDRSGTTDEV